MQNDTTSLKIIPLPEKLALYEYNLILHAFSVCCCNQIATALYLGIPRTTLQSKMLRFGIHTDIDGYTHGLSDLDRAQRKEVRELTRQAVERGEIEKLEFCQDCNDDLPLQMHHEDYTDPYDITWLCYACHVKRHQHFYNKHKPIQLMT